MKHITLKLSVIILLIINSFSSSAQLPDTLPKGLTDLERELIPYVESNFRTHPYRLLEGHSFGGLFSTYALMNKPELFNAFIIQAPALWWNKEEMTGQAKEFFKSNILLMN